MYQIRFASRLVAFLEMLLERNESSWKDRSKLLDLYCFTFKIDEEEFWKSWLVQDLSRQRKKIEFLLKQTRFEGLNGVMAFTAIGYGKLLFTTND